jgi:hypothetical protein
VSVLPVQVRGGEISHLFTARQYNLNAKENIFLALWLSLLLPTNKYPPPKVERLPIYMFKIVLKWLIGVFVSRALRLYTANLNHLLLIKEV